MLISAKPSEEISLPRKAGQIADEAIKEGNYDWHRSVELAIKRYKARGEYSAIDLDNLIDIIRRKIEDEEETQSKIKLEQYRNLRG